MTAKLYQILCEYANWGFTSEGAIYQTYTNRTGSKSVKGTIVISSTSYDNSVEIAPANSTMPIGVIYEDGVDNGAPVKVVVYGKTQVLLRDTEAAVHGYWCGVSSTAGRMYQSSSLPSDASAHNREIGHCLESKSEGTNVLAYVHLHFN